MNIAVDGGGLCVDLEHRFGNYIVSENIIRSLLSCDTKNSYTVYSFCKKPNVPDFPVNWNYKELLPKRFWMKARVSLEELMHPKDIFLALNQAMPLYTRSRVISFCHGLSYLRFPKLYEGDYRRLFWQLGTMMRKSDCVVASSAKVKKELLEINPKNKNIVVIPFGIPFDMTEANRPTGGRKKYFLHVGMDHPIKNIGFIKEAFEKFRKNRKYKEYRLICITGGVTRSELKRFYQEATGYLTASHYESFNLPVLEALSQNCPVIGLKTAIIPEMKKYTEVVDSEKEFIERMGFAADGKLTKINNKLLAKEFSWRKYMKYLLELY